MKGQWVDNPHGNGARLDLGVTSGAVDWTDDGWRGRVSGRTKTFPVIDDGFEAAKRWVEQALNDALVEGLRLLRLMPTRPG